MAGTKYKQFEDKVSFFFPVVDCKTVLVLSEFLVECLNNAFLASLNILAVT